MTAAKSAALDYAAQNVDLPPKDGSAAVIVHQAQGSVSVVPNEAESFLAMIERASRDPTVDAAKMRAFLDMRLQVMAMTAEQEFNRAMMAVQQQMLPVARNAVNKETHSRWAKLETISSALTPIATRNGFSLSFGTDNSPIDKHYRITCKVSHTGGHSRDYFADIPADLTGPKGTPNKSATHGFGSTMSYGRRYLTLLIFNVIIVDEDNDGNGARKERRADEPDPNAPINEAQLQAIQRLIVKSGTIIEKFCAFFKIERVADLPVSRFEEARGMLNRKAAPAKAGAK